MNVCWIFLFLASLAAWAVWCLDVAAHERGRSLFMSVVFVSVRRYVVSYKPRRVGCIGCLGCLYQVSVDGYIWRHPSELNRFRDAGACPFRRCDDGWRAFMKNERFRSGMRVMVETNGQSCERRPRTSIAKHLQQAQQKHLLVYI